MSSELPKKVTVALSGGVDSSVAASLLKESGFEVHGAHIKMWSDPKIPCTTKEDRHDAMRVAAKLNIPFETWDFTAEYRKAVVNYMINEYAAGRTPNPDVMCNREIKFGVFLKRALESGADAISTGHYVIKSQNHNETAKLLRSKDKNKDQSYFLWTLTQHELSRSIFPVGEYTKPEVRALAKKLGLPTAQKKDSQGLCFMGKIDVHEFLKGYISEKPGTILTTSGKIIGEHAGLEFYTIGQRHGLSIGGGTPYYVAAKDLPSNTLVVAENDDVLLYKNNLSANNVNWIPGGMERFPFKCKARIRYRQPLQECTLESAEDSGIRVIFDKPQRAVTPGQSIVFYQGEEMLGGAVIL